MHEEFSTSTDNKDEQGLGEESQNVASYETTLKSSKPIK